LEEKGGERTHFLEKVLSLLMNNSFEAIMADNMSEIE